MFRALRLLLVPALTLVVAAAAWAGPACDSEKASTEQVSTQPAADKACGAKSASAANAGTCAKSASASTCVKSAKSADQASADCVYCDFVIELKASKETVTVTTVETENGVCLVFASVTEDGVETAQVVATKAYSMMNSPAHCDVSRAKMADASCGGCKAGLSAFANAEVTMEKTDSGAETMILVKDEKQAEQVKAFFAAFQNTEPAKG